MRAAANGSGVAELGVVRPYSISVTTPLMQNQPASEIELLRAAYTAFNARDIDAALATHDS